MTFLFILGFATGLLVVHYSLIIPNEGLENSSPEEFWQKHPDKKWLRFFLYYIPFFWIVIFLFLVPLFIRVFDPGTLSFSITFWFMGGISLIDGMFELFGSFSPERRLSFASTNRSRGLQLVRFKQGLKIPRYGLLRIAILIIIGFALPILFQPDIASF